MNQSVKSMQCIASNLCHEIVNHFSVIKFLQSDIQDGNNDSISDLFARLDLLFLYVDFFRSIFTSADSANDVFKITSEICYLKKLHVGPPLITDPVTDKIIAIFLFIIAKSARSNANISFNETQDGISIIAENYTGGVPQSIMNLINLHDQEIDAYNAVVYYALELATEHNMRLSMDFNGTNTLLVQIWKKG